MIPSGEDKPHVLFYGWAFTEEWIWRYAHEHQLEVDLSPKDCTDAEERKKNTLEYGKLDPSLRGKDLPAEEWQLYAVYCIKRAVQQDLEGRCGVVLKAGRPVCDPKLYTGVFALYTNYSAVEQWRHWDFVGRDLDVAVENMNQAMTECGQESELMWWSDLDSLTVSTRYPAMYSAR